MKNLTLLIALLAIPAVFFAQNSEEEKDPNEIYTPELFSGMKYRSVGPSRGGRATAIEGIPSKPFSFYMGSTGGGVWFTDDAGTNWRNISDGQIEAGSIGAIAVAPSDAHTIYVGTGSAAPRGNISAGIGMYKSIDQGKTWEHIGLKDAGQIGSIEVHPNNPKHLFVAALGNIFGPNAERGVFRSKDGGESWENVLFVSDSTGAVEVIMHPENPRILYAAMWRAERKPWTLYDGGEEGGIWKTLDGGDTWKKLAGGLPTGTLGKIGLAISPAQPERVWAQIQTAVEKDGGLYRTDNGGDAWTKVNRDHKLRQRGWYYSHITAHPTDPNTIFASNTGFYKSIDGGKTFDQRIPTPHGDNHGVWINPNHPDIMINCNDGGANVTLNGGKSWSTINNQATSEFYRLTVDNQFPYRLYAGQQDNTTISVPSQRMSALSSTQHWLAVGGSECADVAVDPRDPNIIYATSYSGEITYKNLASGEERQVTAYPHYTEGTKQRDLKYRWQWNFPVFVSTYKPDHVYMGSNFVHRSSNQGQTWEIISPDLTRKLDQYHDIPGGPVQHDATGVEVYSSIFALEESPLEEGVIWVGTDDGRMHITKDGGETWTDISPKNIPTEATINKIECSMHDAGRAFAAVYHYRYNDFKPYILRTDNYGKNWKLLTDGNNGIPQGHFVRAIAEDPSKKGLLYAGTEYGMYISFNDGKNWQPFQLNLPHTPITDMEVHKGDLVLSTQGRAFWILDDLSPVRQLDKDVADSKLHLFKPRGTYRTNVGGWGGMPAKFALSLSEKPDSATTVSMEVLDKDKKVIQTWSTKKKEEGDEWMPFMLNKGLNHLTWNLRYPSPKMVKDFVAMVYSANYAPGPWAVPGMYYVRVKQGDTEQIQSFEIKRDPRWTDISIEDYQAQFDLAQEVIDLINESQDQIRNIRAAREQMNAQAKRAVKAGYDASLEEKAKAISKKLSAIEDILYQTQIETSQDEINYPRKFTNHIARLYRVIVDDHDRPTGGMLERYADLKEDYAKAIAPLAGIFEKDMAEFHALMDKEGVERIILPAGRGK